jgi:hypothetical protein
MRDSLGASLTKMHTTARLASITLIAACASSDLRPGNLTGSVTCSILDTASTTPLTVRIVLDSTAAARPARMDILPNRSDPVSAGYQPNRLVAGFGAADGSIRQCGGVMASVIRFDVSRQMASYPTWARAYSSEPVNWLIVDSHDRALADSLQLVPGTHAIRVHWHTR